MKKYFFAFLCSFFLVYPNTILAKKVTCSNGEYNATVEIDKEKLGLSETAFISVTSDTKYDISYKVNNQNYIEIDDLGIIKALKEGTVTIETEVKFIEKSNVLGSCKVDFQLEIVSNDSTLKSLNLEELDISSIFKKDKYEYEIRLPYNFEKINIIAEANNSGAKITGDGRRYLNEGNNEYNIIVTATDGTTSTYKIIIIREAANDDITLKSLIVEGYVLTPIFEKNTYKYTLSVDKDVDEITINATPTYEFSKIKGTGKFILATGKSTYYITVTAENGNEAVYEIEIIKNNGSSALKNLKITDAQLDSEFKSDKYIYYAKVNSNIKTVDIKAEAEDNDQVEIIGDEKLKYGENEIIIRVTGEDKTSTTYKLIITRLSIEEEKEIEKNNMLLKILLIMFIIAIIIMATSIGIFIKKNYKKSNKNIKIKLKNKKK